MTDWNGSNPRGARAVETLLWACAGLIVLTAHVGAAAWLLSEPPMEVADSAPPVAIMIELAPEPEAVNTEENEVAPDQQSAEQSEPVEEVETPEETPPVEEVIETQPEQAEPEPVVEQEPEPVEEETVELPDEVEVPLPVFRPKPPEPKKEVVRREEPKPKPVRQRQPPKAKSNAAVEAQAQVRQSNRNAARQSTSGLFSSSVSPARWQSRLMAHLERRKKYPADARRRGEQGTVYVRFRIDDDGNVQSVSLARSSGYPALDQEVLSLVRRASPVPAPPPGVNKSITAPVRFDVR